MSSDCEKVIKLETEKSALVEALQCEKDRADALARAHEVAAANNKSLAKKLEEAEIELEVEKRLGP